MSNTKFTGLQDRNLLLTLKGFISEHLPELDAALSASHGRWQVSGNRFVFRYAPGNYRREEFLLKVYRQEPLSVEEQLLLTLLDEASTFRGRLIDDSGVASSWDAVSDVEPSREFPGLSLYLQDWWTSSKGKTKRSHSGLEICFVAAEAEEEAEEEEAPATSPSWGDS